jgi:hypothetical protein
MRALRRLLLTDLFLACGAGAKDLVSGPGVMRALRRSANGIWSSHVVQVPKTWFQDLEWRRAYEPYACCRREALKLPQRTQREEKHAHKRTMELLLLSLFCSHLLPIMSPASALV